MRRRVPLLAIALLVSVASASALAQKFIPKSIQFQGDPEYSTDELMAAAGLKLGAVLARDNMNDVAKKLMATGVFDQLAYKFDGQDLIFSMTPASELFPVRIDNLPIIPGPTLDADLHKRFPLYHGKVPSEGTLLDDVRGAFESMIAAERIKASVTAVPYGDRKIHNKVTAMSFTISSPPVRVGAIQFEGASPALLPRLQATASREKDALFESNNSAAALEQKIMSLYQDLGYAAVQVHAVQSGQPVMDANAIEVPQLVTVHEGRTYKIIAISLPPDCLVTQEEADKILAASDSQMPGAGLRTILSRIDGRYKSKGYLDLVVTPHPDFNESAATVNYAIEIVPGAVYHVAYVKFENVSDDLRAHLMRAWQLLPGDPMDISYLDAFLLKATSQDPVLRRSLVGMLARYETSADPVTHDVDIDVHLEK
jgi:outer membrane protein assembly factor BamA